jgi:hypothetical protein
MYVFLCGSLCLLSRMGGTGVHLSVIKIRVTQRNTEKTQRCTETTILMIISQKVVFLSQTF